MNIKSRIYESYLNEGMRCTLDFLCKSLKISKKTIYNIFASKNELEYQTLIYLCHQINLDILEIRQKKLLVPDEFKALSFYWYKRVVCTKTYKIFFSDNMIPKKQVSDLPNNSLLSIKDAFRENLIRGVNENYYYKNLDFSLILNFYWSLINSLNQYTYRKYNYSNSDDDVKSLAQFHLNSISLRSDGKNN